MLSSALAALVLAAAAAARVMDAQPPAAGRTTNTLDLGNGQSLTYDLVLPDNFNPASSYPALLIFPPGNQDQNTVIAATSFVEPDCRTRGWVVLCPTAVNGQPYHHGGQKYVFPLLAHVQRSVRVEGGRWHVAGADTGGLSAFAVALESPERFRSIVTMPGYVATPADRERLSVLKDMTVRMFVGSDDRVEWTDGTRQTLALARELGVDAQLSVRQAQPHHIRDLTPREVFDALEPLRSPAGTLSQEQNRVANVLDEFHIAASIPSESRYFGCFAPEGVFIGTDAGERWTLDDFRTYARPFFSKGRGWTYVPVTRHIDLSPDGNTAWFDELLRNDKYGTCRGSGVLLRLSGQWRVSQYHLTVPVPNDLLPRVAKMIQTAEKQEQDKQKLERAKKK